jgi:hypothetical protein
VLVVAHRQQLRGLGGFGDPGHEYAAVATDRERRRSVATAVRSRERRLPDDYAYFNHAIHVKKGVGCSTCHGRVDDMPIIYQSATLQMEWCLECHRKPERFIRPVKEIFNMEWRPENKTEDELAKALLLKSEYKIQGRQILESCSTCHR